MSNPPFSVVFVFVEYTPTLIVPADDDTSCAIFARVLATMAIESCKDTVGKGLKLTRQCLCEA
jgi:hypothetical protein